MSTHMFQVLFCLSQTVFQTWSALLASFISSIFNFDLKKKNVCISKRITWFEGSQMALVYKSCILAEFAAQLLQRLFLLFTNSLQLRILILQPVKLLIRHKDTSEPKTGCLAFRTTKTSCKKLFKWHKHINPYIDGLNGYYISLPRHCWDEKFIVLFWVRWFAVLQQWVGRWSLVLFLIHSVTSAASPFLFSNQFPAAS